MSIPSIVAAGRRLIGTSFLDTCVIADRSLVRDSRGGQKATWTARSAQEPCRFVALKDDEPEVKNGQEFGVPTAVWMAPLGIEVDEGDRITNLLDGSKWIVTSNLTPPSNLAVSLRYGIREANQGEAG